jgi:hypothetical protein
MARLIDKDEAKRRKTTLLYSSAGGLLRSPFDRSSNMMFKGHGNLSGNRYCFVPLRNWIRN